MKMKKKTLIIGIGSALLIGAVAVTGISALASEQQGHTHANDATCHTEAQRHCTVQDNRHDQHDQNHQHNEAVSHDQYDNHREEHHDQHDHE